MSYKERKSGFLSGMEQNTSLNENQRSLSSLKAAEMLEYMLNNLAGLDTADLSTEI